MFNGATAFNQPIGTWNTGAVTNMSQMFQNATAFNQPIGTWNTGAATSVSGMFSGCLLYTSKALLGNLADILAINFDCATINVHKPQQQAYDRRLTRARLTDNTDFFTCIDRN